MLSEPSHCLSGDKLLLHPVVLSLAVSSLVLLFSTVTFCALWRNNRHETKPKASEPETSSGKYV